MCCCLLSLGGAGGDAEERGDEAEGGLPSDDKSPRFAGSARVSGVLECSRSRDVPICTSPLFRFATLTHLPPLPPGESSVDTLGENHSTTHSVALGQQ